MKPDRVEDRHFVERVASSYAPNPQTPAERAAFDAALDAKLAGRPRRALLPALAGAVAAAALAWALLPSGKSDDGTLLETRAAAQWEYELIYPSDATVGPDAFEEEMLPDDYDAIGSLFLEG